MTRVFTTWLPVKERERAQANLWLAARLTAAFTPILVALLIQQIGWRRTFEMFGALGVIWAVLFYRWYSRCPASTRRQRRPSWRCCRRRATPRSRIRRVRGASSFQALRVAALIQYMCLAYGWWFYINWLPTYLRDGARHHRDHGRPAGGAPAAARWRRLPGLAA